MLSRNVGASIILRVNGGWGVMSGQVFIDRSGYHRYYKVGTVSKECPDFPLLRSVIDIVGYVVSFLLAACNGISGENLRVTSPLKQARRYLLHQTRADRRVDGFATKQVIDVFFYRY